MKNRAFFMCLILIATACKKEETPKESLYPKVAQTPTELGREIFEDKAGCAACHLPEQKIVGPSIQEIAKIYKDKNASIITFLQGNAEPIVDPSQYEVMKTNFEITKMMSDQELQAIEAYMYSHLK